MNIELALNIPSLFIGVVVGCFMSIVLAFIFGEIK